MARPYRGDDWQGWVDGKYDRRRRAGIAGGVTVIFIAAIIAVFAYMETDAPQVEPPSVRPSIEPASSPPTMPPTIRPMSPVPMPTASPAREEIEPSIQYERLELIQGPAGSDTAPILDVTWIEMQIHAMTNAERRNYGLPELEYDEQIAHIARLHSTDMAERKYFDHTSPSGMGAADRGMPYGYDTCGGHSAFMILAEYDGLYAEYEALKSQVDAYRDRYYVLLNNNNREAIYEYNSMIGELNSLSDKVNRAAGGLNGMDLAGGLAENIFMGWTYSSYTEDDRGNIISYEWNTGYDIAEDAVVGWMNSPGHRENILSDWRVEGIGMAIADDGSILVTQNFC